MEVGERPFDAARQRFYAYIGTGGYITEVTAPNYFELERKAVAVIADRMRVEAGLAPIASA